MNGMSYAAIKKCGCIVGAVSLSADAETVMEALKEFTQWAKKKKVDRVEVVSDEQVRANFYAVCPHKPQQMGMFEEGEVELA